MIFEQNGVALPVKDPGLLGIQGLTLASEIKAGSALVFFLLGGLLTMKTCRVQGSAMGLCKAQH